MFYNGTRLRVTKRIGNVLSGWDYNGYWQEVKVTHDLARKIGEQLCYVKEAGIVNENGIWKAEKN